MNISVEKTVTKKEGKFYGASLQPNMRGRLKECDSKEDYLTEVAYFEENDANCNTCKFLKRIPHEKSIFGFLKGICTKPSNILDKKSYYGRFFISEDTKELNISFHPDDAMLNNCWETRRK
jgi:hypothetical protein